MPMKPLFWHLLTREGQTRVTESSNESFYNLQFWTSFNPYTFLRWFVAWCWNSRFATQLIDGNFFIFFPCSFRVPRTRKLTLPSLILFVTRFFMQVANNLCRWSDWINEKNILYGWSVLIFIPSFGTEVAHESQ